MVKSFGGKKKYDPNARREQYIKQQRKKAEETINPLLRDLQKEYNNSKPVPRRGIRKHEPAGDTLIGRPQIEPRLSDIMDEKAEGKSIYHFGKGKLHTGKARLLRLRLASVFSAAKKKDEDKKDDIETEEVRKSVYGKKKDKLTKEEREEEQNFDPPHTEELEESSRAYGDSYGDWHKTGKQEKEEYAYEDYFGKKYKKKKGKKVNLSRDDSLHLQGS